MSLSRVTRRQRVASADHEEDKLVSARSRAASHAPSADHRPDLESRRVKPGRPSPLQLSSSILLSPESVMALDGKSMRGAFQEVGQISLFKGLERAVKLRLPSIPPTLAKSLVEFAERANPSRARDLDFLVRAIVHGDSAAREELEALGPWAALQAGLFGELPANSSRWTEQFVEIEVASKAADRLLAQEAYAQAADALDAEPRLRVYLTDQALTMLRTASGKEPALFARAAGAVDVLLSSAARNDVTSRADMQADQSFDWLFELGPDGQMNVGRAWVQRMVQNLGRSTLEGLIDLAQDPKKPNRTFVDLATLKRWHSGKVFPSVNKLSPFFKAVLAAKKSTTDVDLEVGRYGCAFGSALRIHKCLELVALVDAKLLAAGREVTLTQLLGHESPSEWAQARYSFWLRHWQSRGLEEGWADTRCPPASVS